jgi:hypothetical protein
MRRQRRCLATVSMADGSGMAEWGRQRKNNEGE